MPTLRTASRPSPQLLVVAETVELIAEAWEPFEALRVETVERLDVVLAADLPAVINESGQAAVISWPARCARPWRSS